MRTLILTLILLVMTHFAHAQDLETTIAKTICTQIDSADVQNFTPDQRRKFLMLCLAKSYQLHKTQIDKDPRFAGLSSYESGKRYGQIVGKNVTAILSRTCPKYKKYFE